MPSPEDARALIERATEEAERVRAEARAEAEDRLAKVAGMREAVIALREQAHGEAAGLRSQAQAVLEAAHREVEETRRAAAAERVRLDEEAAEARARREAEAAARAREERAAAETELAALHAERDRVHEALRALTGHVDHALTDLAAVLADDAVPADELPDDVSVLAERRDAAARDETPRTPGADVAAAS